MQFLQICITFITIIIYSKNTLSFNINFPLIGKDYFERKNYQHGTCLVCGPVFDLKVLSNTLHRTANIRLTIKNIDSEEFWQQKNVENLFPSKIFLDTKIRRTAIILDVDCASSIQILNFASETELLDENHHWLLIGEDLNRVTTLLTPLELRLDSNVLFAAPGNTSKDPWTIFDFYNPGLKYGGKIKVKFYGFWFPSIDDHISQPRKILGQNPKPMIGIIAAEKQSEGFKLDKKDWCPDQEKFINLGRWRIYLLGDTISQRHNLEGITIDSVVAITNKISGSFMDYLSTPFDVEMDTMHRHNYILYLILMEMYNFKTTIQRTNSWGYIKNGSWTGVIGVLVRNEAELSITPTQFKSDRFHVVDQTAITWLARPAMIFRHPTKESGLNKDSFTKPLAANVWWATIGVLALVTILLRIALRHEASFLEQNDTQHSAEMREDDSWNYPLLLVLPGALFQQGIMHNPTIPSGRTISLFLLIFTFILYQFYSASIVSSLLSEPPRTINTIADLLRSELKVVIEDIPYNYDFFETTTDPVALELYKRKVIPTGTTVNFLEPKIGLEKVRKGGYAFQIDVATAYKMIPETFSERAVCELAEIQLFPPKPVITITRKYSPYREIITKGLRKMHESGILQYQRAVWHHPRPQCPPSAQGDISSVTITEVATALILLLVGAALALFIFVGEAVVARRSRS